MSNEKGYSWPESVLSLVILTVVFGTLLPLYSNMSTRLEMKKMSMHAAESAYHGAILYQTYGMMAGENQIEKNVYRWSVEGKGICATYHFIEQEFVKCIGS
jgi:type II secretory pathway pseudopilin PulG